MSHYQLSRRSMAGARCEATVNDAQGRPTADRCKFYALPGQRFCKRHGGAANV